MSYQPYPNFEDIKPTELKNDNKSDSPHRVQHSYVRQQLEAARLEQEFSNFNVSDGQNFTTKLFTIFKDPCKGYGFNVTADGDNQNSSVVSEVASDGRAIKQGLKKGHRIVEVNRVNVYNSPTKTTVAMISSSEDLVDIRVIEKDVAQYFDSKLFTVIKDPCKGYGFKVTADGDNQNSSVVSEVASDGRAIKQGLKKGHRIVEVNNVNVYNSPTKTTVGMISNSGDLVNIRVIEKDVAQYFDSRNIVPSEEHLGQQNLDFLRSNMPTKLDSRGDKDSKMVGMKFCEIRKDPCNGFGLSLASDGDNKNSSVVSDVAANGAAMKQGIKKGHRLVEINGLNVYSCPTKTACCMIKDAGNVVALLVIEKSDAQYFDSKNIVPSMQHLNRHYSDIMPRRTAPPPPPKTYNFKITGGEFGFDLSKKPEHQNKPVISALVLNGPAYEAGLKIGDCIVEINNDRVYEKDPATVERMLKQSTGLAVEFLVVGREELAVFQSKQVYPGKGVHVKKSMFGQTKLQSRVHSVKRKDGNFGFWLSEEQKHSSRPVVMVDAFASGIRNYDRIIEINGVYVYNTPANDVRKMMSLIKDDIEIVVINEAAHKYHEKNGTLPQKKNVIDMSPR